MNVKRRASSSGSKQDKPGKVLNKVIILRVTPMAELWICEKDPKGFIKMMHTLISKDEYQPLYDAHLHFENKLSQHSNMFALFDAKSQTWLRAYAIQQTQSFGESSIYTCYLIDSGETITAPKSKCRRLINPELIKYPPLAKQCTLHGIQLLSNQ